MDKKKLPLIELKINPDDGSFVQAIAIVNDPAIQSNFIAFSNQKQEQFTTNDEMQELIGAAMIPDSPIYRYSKELGEYAVTFSKKTIREIAQVFAQKGLLNQMNIEHTNQDAKSYVFQSYIVDSTKGINSPKGIEAPDGSWIVGVKVTDIDVWKKIKTGEINGFSVEGIFDLIDTNTTVQLSKDKIIESEFDKALNEFIGALEDYFNK